MARKLLPLYNDFLLRCELEVWCSEEMLRRQSLVPKVFWVQPCLDEVVCFVGLAGDMGKDFVVVDYHGGSEGGAEAGFILGLMDISLWIVLCNYD